MIASGTAIKGATVNLLGVTFKENCADLRNSKVIDIIRELESYGLKVNVADPLASAEETRYEYGINLSEIDDLPAADALIVEVSHSQYQGLTRTFLRRVLAPTGVFVDVKSIFNARWLEEMGFNVWRL